MLVIYLAIAFFVGMVACVFIMVAAEESVRRERGVSIYRSGNGYKCWRN